jgi:hypothetical protein
MGSFIATDLKRGAGCCNIVVQGVHGGSNAQTRS